jgi:hypothetical protein
MPVPELSHPRDCQRKKNCPWTHSVMIMVGSYHLERRIPSSSEGMRCFPIARLDGMLLPILEPQNKRLPLGNILGYTGWQCLRRSWLFSRVGLAMR